MKTWSLNRTESSELAKAIAADIFNAGEECGERPHRIAFKLGGYWPGCDEKEGGGYCESALAQRIDASLKEHQSKGGIDG